MTTTIIIVIVVTIINVALLAGNLFYGASSRKVKARLDSCEDKLSHLSTNFVQHFDENSKRIDQLHKELEKNNTVFAEAANDKIEKLWKKSVDDIMNFDPYKGGNN